MAAGDQLRSAAVAAKQASNEKRRQVQEVRNTVEKMKRDMDHLNITANEWEREITNLDKQVVMLEQQARDADDAEKRMRDAQQQTTTP